MAHTLFAHDLPAPPASSDCPATRRDTLLAKYMDVRHRTVALAAPLSPEDCQVQSMPDASPVKWHLAHSTWFFETFILAAFDPAFRAFSPDFKILFNSYYNAVGEKHPRSERGLLTRPTLEQVLAYREHVDAAIGALGQSELPDDSAFDDLIALGLHHEQQHQELMLMDVKHMLSCNPLKPAYRSDAANAPSLKTVPAESPMPGAVATSPIGWVSFDGGVVRIGHDGSGFAFDNESPSHDIFLQPYCLAHRLVTQGEYLAFVMAGGYHRPDLWLAAGWDTVCRLKWEAPLYWSGEADQWRVFTLDGLVPLDPESPVVHLSYYEADAFARWAGARLPREGEWEHAARSLSSPDTSSGNFLESGMLRPGRAARDAQPSPVQPIGVAALPTPLQQMYGDVWEWTSSGYEAYPGFSAPAGAVGEYNGKFMCNQYVLRGGSFGTPRSHIRATYRNFFPADTRWQFSGLRLAKYV